MNIKLKRSFKYMADDETNWPVRETNLEWFKEWVRRSRIMMPYHKGESYGWK